MKAPEIRMGAGSEGGHWYVPGDPVQCAYEILGANGKWRATTLRDARKHGWYPGVTTIIRAAAAPALERWKVQQGILSALTSPHDPDDPSLLRKIEEDAKEEARQAARKGTEIHAAIERYYSGQTCNKRLLPYVESVKSQLHALTGEDDDSLWQTELAATHPYGIGTRIDLFSRELGVVIDFKSKDFELFEQQKAWPNQGMQLAACKHILEMPWARCVNIFLSRTNVGLVQSFEWSQADDEKHWDQFCWLLGYWQSSNNLPTWSRLRAAS